MVHGARLQLVLDVLPYPVFDYPSQDRYIDSIHISQESMGVLLCITDDCLWFHLAQVVYKEKNTVLHPMQPLYNACLRMLQQQQHGLCTIGYGVTVRQSTLHPAAGLGLFVALDRSIAKGECITGYHSVLMDRNSAEALRRIGRDTQIRTINHELCVDGAMTPNEAGLSAGSFANDGTPCGVRNNARFRNVYAVDGLVCLPVVVASRDIAAGEEIIVPYGATYWKAHWPLEKPSPGHVVHSTRCAPHPLANSKREQQQP